MFEIIANEESHNHQICRKQSVESGSESDPNAGPHKTSDASLKTSDSGLFSASSVVSRKTMSSKTVTLSVSDTGFEQKNLGDCHHE